MEKKTIDNKRSQSGTVPVSDNIDNNNINLKLWRQLSMRRYTRVVIIM